MGIGVLELVIIGMLVVCPLIVTVGVVATIVVAQKNSKK
ncbi:hypothetical protein Enr8_25080 [Blastopirellula retiformator]|uniref:Uncharacterized protein n=1 Tax=Blastopirellula retiformator TaxID=2527970 RepID=A0A5C5V416_9BACT|nr:hypothetical protein Enr8_25080 [Blastopirellula retiformator]